MYKNKCSIHLLCIIITLQQEPYWKIRHNIIIFGQIDGGKNCCYSRIYIIRTLNDDRAVYIQNTQRTHHPTDIARNITHSNTRRPDKMVNTYCYVVFFCFFYFYFYEFRDTRTDINILPPTMRQDRPICYTLVQYAYSITHLFIYIYTIWNL